MSFAVVVIGGSAGSLPALRALVHELPEDIPAAFFVVTHVPPDSVSAMPHILSRSGPLFATHGIDGAPVAPGRIVVAPPDNHLLLQDGVMRVVQTARENGQRPSIDVLFRSAAQTFGARTCAVLLSGALDDGVAGMLSIQRAGGCTIAQEPADALFPDMPQNAITAEAAEIVVPADLMGAAVAEVVESRSRADEPLRSAADVAPDERTNGVPSVFTCPDCGGTLWELEDGENLRFRCRTGHAYNINAISSAQQDRLENSLWAALRTLEERADLVSRLARRAEQRGDRYTAERFTRQSEELRKQETTLRQALNGTVTQIRSGAS